MSVLSHQSYANLKTPLWLSNPVPELVLAGTPQITLSNNAGTLYINGSPMEQVSNWYLYSASNGIILMGDPLNPDTLESAGGNLYFNGEILAQAGQISNVSDWSLYVALQNVDVNGFGLRGVEDINGFPMSYYATSNWSSYPALQNVNMSNFGISNITTITGGTIGITTTSNYNVTCANDLTMTAIDDVSISAGGSIDPANFVDLNLTAGGGNRGRVNITANSGVGGIQGEVRIVANGGSTPLGNVGGLVEIVATTPVGLEPTLTSAIKFSAAGINSYAGAVPSVGSLAGYNFIYGNLGVNICAGLPPILPNTPSTTYIYGTGGVNLESGFGSDVQVKDSDFGARKIIPYYSALAPVSNLVITGRSNLLLPNQYVTMSMVQSILMCNGGSISNLEFLNGLPVSNYVTSNWWSYSAGGDVNMATHNISNVGNLQVNTINGSAYPPAVPNWATIPASQNVNMNNFSISNLVNINGVPYVSGTQWSSYPAGQNVNMCNFSISNVSNIALSNINGTPYNPTAFSNWASYPASQNVNMSNFSISNLSQAFIGNVSVKQGANVGGSSTTGTETLQVLNSLGGTGNLRVETIAFQNNGGAVNDTILNQVLDALNPPRLVVETNVSAGNTIAYLSDIPSNVRSTYDIYVAVNGNDSSGNGGFNNPFLTIGRAITFRASISTSIPVTIHCLSGTYTESFTLTTNTYIAGIDGSPDPASDPTLIVGNVVLNGVNTGLLAIAVNGNISTIGGNSNQALNNVTITSTTGTAVDIVSFMTMTNCRVNTSGTALPINIQGAGTCVMNDSLIQNNGVSSLVVNAGVMQFKNVTGNLNNASTTLPPLIVFNQSSALTSFIQFCSFKYNSGATDVGGSKYGIQFAGSGAVVLQIYKTMFEIRGAITKFCFQLTGAGSVNLIYGSVEVYGVAYSIGAGITKTSMLQVDEGVYGCFSSSVTTQVSGANVPTAINHNIIEVNNNSILGLQSGNIRLNRDGNYEVSTSIQFYKTGGGTELVYFWFRLNGVDILRSASKIRMQNNNGEVLGNVTCIISASAGDSLSVMFGSTDTTLYAQATGSQTSPMPVPAIPSCITSVKLLN